MSEKSSSIHNNVRVFGELRTKIMKSEAWKNVLEVVSTMLWVDMILWTELFALIICTYVFLCWGLFGKLLCVAYATYWYNDCRSAENGSRGQGSKFMRSLSWLRHFVNFFPIKLVKTVDLPANKNYLFATFPHGVISMGAFGNFATSSTNYHELFPGIRARLCTLNYHFWAPFYRDMLLSWGLISSNRNSLMTVLSQSNNKLAVNNYDGFTANAVILVVGGAQEALYARPGNYRLVLNKRKGFVKIAIQTGASLVPVFSFNEVEVFDQPSNEPGTKLRAYQDFVKKLTGVAPILPYARGLTEKSFGMIPYRRPITTVVGAPIDVKKNAEPSQEEIDVLHAKYAAALVKLFNDHKHKYIKNAENIKLIIE